MTGVTIDHLVASIAFIAAILVFFGLFTQTLQTAILYQQNRHVSLKASELLDSILLSPGYPPNWGRTNTSISCFGLQQSGSKGYTLDSFKLMRLLSSAGGQVYYNRTGKWYSNVSWGVNGGYLLMPVNETISYDTASKSLNVNGSYGFQLTITPTLDITISEIQLNPLILEVEIAGPGFPLGGATVNYHLYSVFGVDVDGFPLFNFNSGSVLADETGVALLDFSSDPQVDGSKAYTVIVDVHLGGLSGVGYKARERVTSAGNIIPFLDSLPSTEGGNATVLLAHKWGKNEPDENMGALHFNATFFSLSDDYEPITVKIENSTGTVNSGGGKPYHPVQIPTSRMGFLIVTYRKGNEYGMTVMAWGLSALGFQIVFGGDPSGQLWAATDIRQVTVTGTAYQAKIACWSLKGYQIWSSR